MGKKFAKNELYNYKVVGVANSKDANLKAEDLEMKINMLAEEGWRLKATFSNADVEELLIFETKKRSSSEIDEINKKYENEERERRRKKIEKQKMEQEKIEEMMTYEQDALFEKLSNLHSPDELYDIYVRVHDRKRLIFELVAIIGEPVSLMELQKLFDNRIDLMTIGEFAEALVTEGKFVKDEETKKYYVL